MVAERFIDTWTKLRVFDVQELTSESGEKVVFERICWLDADMMIFSDPSPFIFNAENDAYLDDASEGTPRLMAVHTCVCNLDHDSWAPKEWNPHNCAVARLSSPEQNATVAQEPYTLSNFNSGTFLYRPSQAISSFVHAKFKEIGAKNLRKMKFPDQDFLNEAFSTRWKSLNWRTNALKTWRYWHPNVWRDNLVCVLHYIVDKPWTARLNPDGKAGYLGKDGETHKWWWDEYFAWEKERKEQGEEELLGSVRKYVAGEKGEVDEEMARSVGNGAQSFAKKWEMTRGEEGDMLIGGGGRLGEMDRKEEAGQEGVLGQGPHGPILRKKGLGERGHGPVVNGRGRGRGMGEGWSIME